jgi:curved DNA-binding protein CbpA
MNADDVINYYGVLGVQQSATVSEIHKAYWHLASRCHPDKGGRHEDMVQLVEAWKILSDPDKRARYDQLLKYRHDGWRSRQFNDDVQDARKHAKDDAVRSWAEFESIYQKAFYTFNQDFYGEEMNGKAAGPYSPLMRSKISTLQGEESAKNRLPGNVSNTAGGTMLAYSITAIILLVIMMVAFFFYRNYCGIGRLVPLGKQDSGSILILDTTTGAVTIYPTPTLTLPLKGRGF